MVGTVSYNPDVHDPCEGGLLPNCGAQVQSRQLWPVFASEPPRSSSLPAASAVTGTWQVLLEHLSADITGEPHQHSSRKNHELAVCRGGFGGQFKAQEWNCV